MNNEAFMVPNPAAPCQALRFDPELCISCYRCADQCRTDVISRGDVKVGGRAPCEAACPAGEDIRWTTWYNEKGQFQEALENIKEENPFPGVCGRVCFHPCEDKCARIGLDQGVGTNAMERAAFDFGSPRQAAKRPATGKKVAVVGAGPAGLACAHFLALLGHKVTVFEASPVAGGIPRVNIPEFRLPAAVVDTETKQIVALGVDIKVNSKIDAAAFAKLKQDYNATFVATGAPLSLKPGVQGEDLNGVVGALDFLRNSRLTGKATVGKSVVVIGGGNVATDSARLARRLGAEQVTMVCLESRDIMPAQKIEIELAEAEGIMINPCWGVKSIVGQGGKVTGVELKGCTAVYDKDSRFSPTYDETKNCVVAADTVILAIGQATDLSFADAKMKGGSRIKIDPVTMATDVPGVYAGGDVGSARGFIVQAIGAGKRAAISIDIFLTGGDKTALSAAGFGVTSMRSYMAGHGAVPENRLPEMFQPAYFGPSERQDPAILPAETRVKSQIEVNPGLNKERAAFEAQRCFRCNQYNPPVTLYPDDCWFCGTCVEECPAPGAIRMEHPLNQRVGWKRKDTGEMFRPGMKDPAPGNLRPAVGETKPYEPLKPFFNLK